MKIVLFIVFGIVSFILGDYLSKMGLTFPLSLVSDLFLFLSVLPVAYSLQLILEKASVSHRA